jgi:acyl-CoA synthetase (AMP-forming)/AMP-acid ligase II
LEFNVAEVLDALGERLDSREAIVTSSLRITWAELVARTNRLAGYFAGHGLGAYAEREALADWEAGQDRVAICLLNGHEFLETMLAAFKARCAPCNVNYRYVAAELAELLADMRPKAVVYAHQFEPALRAALDECGLDPLMIEVGESYEAIATSGSPAPPPTKASLRADDLYVLYTGGTTGRPKGVLWRQADAFVTALGGRNFREGAREWESLDELLVAVLARAGTRGLSAAPFMHGTGQWVSFQVFNTGGTVVIPSVVDRYDATDVLDTVEREAVNLLTIAGEAFAAPLIEALDAKDRDLSSLAVVSSSGAALSPKSKEALVARLPGVRIRDTVGSSEAGPMADSVDRTGRGRGRGEGRNAGAAHFQPVAEACVLDENRSRLLAPGDEETGWLARGGRIPLGYMNDEEKTRATFMTIDGTRYTIPGDRARVLADGTIEVLGRDAVTINSGGEKIFAEEVEAAVRRHPAVRDVLVVGRPSERWGSEVVALVETEPGTDLDAEAVIDACRPAIARYKLPKAVIFVDRVQRNPAGKADYRWARAAVLEGSAPG